MNRNRAAIRAAQRRGRTAEHPLRLIDIPLCWNVIAYATIYPIGDAAPSVKHLRRIHSADAERLADTVGRAEAGAGDQV